MTTKRKKSSNKLSVGYSHFKCNGLEQQIVNCYHKISNDADDCKLKKDDMYYYAATSCDNNIGK